MRRQQGGGHGGHREGSPGGGHGVGWPCMALALRAALMPGGRGEQAWGPACGWQRGGRGGVGGQGLGEWGGRKWRWRCLLALQVCMHRCRQGAMQTVPRSCATEVFVKAACVHSMFEPRLLLNPSCRCLCAGQGQGQDAHWQEVIRRAALTAAAEACTKACCVPAAPSGQPAWHGVSCLEAARRAAHLIRSARQKAPWQRLHHNPGRAACQQPLWQPPQPDGRVFGGSQTRSSACLYGCCLAAAPAVFAEYDVGDCGTPRHQAQAFASPHVHAQ